MRHNKRLGLVLALAAMAVVAFAAAEAPYLPDHVIVKFRVPVTFTTTDGTARTGLAAIDGLSARWGVVAANRLFAGPTNALARRMGLDRVYVLVARNPIDAVAAAREYKELAAVEYAEPDYLGAAQATTPNDPNFSLQWGLNNTGQNPGGGQPGTPGADIDAERAWDIERGSRDIIIGDLDTGMDLDHPDFVANFQAAVCWRNVSEIAGNGVDDDGNGYVDDTIGWNFVGNNNNVQDDNGHGTHTAGIIGAHTNNSTGVAGTCWYCRIMPVKVIAWNDTYAFSWLINGIYYAVNNGARILNMSLGGTVYSSAEEDAINYAWHSGALPVVAMCNSNDDIRHYPAAFDSVIAVGMTDNDDQRVVPGRNGSGSSGSCFGPWIDVMAPGNWIYSTYWNDTYLYMVGTSMATPFVSGTAALMLSRNPDLTNYQLRSILESTAEDLGAPGYDTFYGWGRINAYQALEQVQFLPGWTTERMMATSSNGAYEPDIVVSGENVHIVYTQKGADPDWGIWYIRSTDGGRTFDAPRKLTTCTTNWVSYHPRIAVSGNHIGLVFMDTRAVSTHCGIYFTESSDNGLTWSPDRLLSDLGTDSYDPDVCRAGDTIHVIWNTGYRRSTDGGSNWDAINTGVSGQAIACGNGRVFVVGTLQSSVNEVYLERYSGGVWTAMTFATDGTCLPSPDVAVDGDHVYIAWDQDVDGDGTPEDIQLLRSANGGSSWSPTVKLAVLGGNFEFRAPRLDAGSGRVHLVWYGDRDQYWSVDTYYRSSSDYGATWGHSYRLCYNDYNDFDELPSVAFFADTVHVVWDRMASGTKSIYYIRKGIAPPKHDVGAYRIVAPLGTISPYVGVTPEAMVRNYGEMAEDFSVRFRIGGVYSDDTTVTGLAAGDSALVRFQGWDAVEGDYVATCSTMLATDVQRGNDSSMVSFRVSTVGLNQVQPDDTVPTLPSGKQVKDGGWLATGGGKGAGAIYAAKGNKASDFYAYDPAAHTWTSLSPIPDGREGKPPRKGSVGVAAGGYVYMTKGNNTLGFWRYNIARDSWEQLDDVPAGGNKVKGGTDLVYVPWTGTDYLYLLKGCRREFLRFNLTTLKWESRDSAPAGGHAKWNPGSWLAYDGAGLIYAHKARYQEFYSYDVARDSWGPVRDGMPQVGMLGRARKTGDGGCATWLDGAVYALKGNNTQEFWKYLPGTKGWTELETIPRRFFTSSRPKKVKAGADIVAFSGTLYFTKGNNTDEVWRYTPGSAGFARQPGREGVTAGRGLAGGECRLSIAPNPLATGCATLRYSLPAAGPMAVAVHDVAGRTVMTKTVPASRTGSVVLDLRSLNAGVYLVKLSTCGYTTAQKLIVRR